ncbi:MAG: hypothetical protein IPM16_18430 [Chloroflexi bacterium]|nr:hypothetical protein [Chloroflexota bacterium]
MRIAFPTPSYMRNRYGVSPGKSVWPYYAHRWFDQGREVVAVTRKRQRQQ